VVRTESAIWSRFKRLVIDVPENFIGIIRETIGSRRGGNGQNEQSQFRRPAACASISRFPPPRADYWPAQPVATDTRGKPTALIPLFLMADGLCRRNGPRPTVR